jgi:hypothetical protein
LGGFGKKKKKPEDQPATTQPTATDGTQQASASGSAPTASAGTSGALMEMTIEVTSFSNSALDGSLFDVPAGYAQVQPDLETKPGRH